MKVNTSFRALTLGVCWCGLIGACCCSVPQGDPATRRTANRDVAEQKLVLLLAADLPTSGSSNATGLRPEYPADARRAEREAMVREQIERRGVRDAAVLAAMRRVPRHLFVGEREAALAYGDFPLPIGRGQTISQPFIVGTMTEMLHLKRGDRVLEIGTGSGYQAAILAEIVDDVSTIEIVDALARQAAARLRRLGYRNINVLSGDGYAGWARRAPYDAILVTAAADHIPEPLTAQLKPGGRMIIPVGEVDGTQNLVLVTKQADGTLGTRRLPPVRFVPLTRKQD